MAYENGEWIMHGRRWDDPRRAKTWRELIALVRELGFLPLFKNSVDGFSAEEFTSGMFWWSGDPEQDPWFWRELIARSGEVAYGKFFDKKAGFISLDWLPVFANWRRDGYDFDARWDDELANIREKKIMDCFALRPEWTGFELKREAGFGKNGGEKNFDGVLAALQMRAYLVIRDFRCKTNRRGGEYGMPVAVYSTPESVWGEDAVRSTYSEPPAVSRGRMFGRVRELFPRASEAEIKKLLDGGVVKN